MLAVSLHPATTAPTKATAHYAEEKLGTRTILEPFRHHIVTAKMIKYTINATIIAITAIHLGVHRRFWIGRIGTMRTGTGSTINLTYDQTRATARM